MIRFSKLLFLNPAKIWISGIQCNAKNTAKIVDVFDCKSIIVTIDSIESGSDFITLMQNQGLDYLVIRRSGSYLEISVILPYTLFEAFLEKAIDEGPENIFVTSLLDSANSRMYLHCSSEELVATGIANVFISISLDEHSCMICLNKSLFLPQEVFKRIKGLRFD